MTDSTITHDKLLAQSKLLTDFLPKLKTGELSVIEYGEDNNPGGRLSFLRIRYMNTAGGPQFCLKQLSSLGLEGSGFYSPDIADMSLMATRMLLHYHRKPRLFAVQPTVPLTWFAFEEGDQKPPAYFPIPDTTLPPDTVTVNL